MMRFASGGLLAAVCVTAFSVLAGQTSLGSHIGDYRVGYSGGINSSGAEVTGTGTCSAADSVARDNNGTMGCQKLTNVAPQGLMLRPQPAFAGGSQTAAELVLCGGQDESTIAIDGADPSATCAGDNDTVTVTVINSNGSSTATVLTEGTDWTASASVANTCASLATAVNALSGVGASCTSPNVRVTLDNTTCVVTFAESTAGCTTVSTGTDGAVYVPARSVRFDNQGTGTVTRPSVCFGADCNTGFYERAADGINVMLGGTQRWNFAGVSLVSSTSGGPQIVGSLPTITAPSLVPNQTETDTGIGWQSDAIALIGGGATSSLHFGSANANRQQWGASTFANLDASATNGTVAYCSDCNKATPCTGGGSGAVAKRLNGAWDCD